MITVYKRELRAYLTRPEGWGVVAGLLFVAGLAVLLRNLLVGHAQIEYALLDACYVLPVAIPLLAMRSMSSDRKSGMDRFYRSLPLAPLSVVMGKYLALLSVFAIPCGVLCLCPVILRFFGTVSLASSYNALLQFFLLGAVLIALCQLISSLTRHPAVSAAVGVGASAGLLLLPIVGALFSLIPVPTLSDWLYDFFGWLSPFTHFEENAAYGLFSVRSLVLYLSQIILFLLLTLRSLEARGKKGGVRHA